MSNVAGKIQGLRAVSRDTRGGTELAREREHVTERWSACFGKTAMTEWACPNAE